MSLFKYGGYFNINKNGVWVMINGRCFTFFKSLNSGKWQFKVWDNIWRKTKEQCPKHKPFIITRPDTKRLTGEGC